MFSTRRFRRACRVGLFVLIARAAAAQPAAPSATLYRIFLQGGSTLVSYGEFARVADQVVFSIPLGGTDAEPRLQVISIPASSVDWDKTDAYADSARAARYAATRGPEDFALLSEAVSRALGDIALTQDHARQIQMAWEARQNVMRWAADHYAYRAPDVARLASMFDDAIAQAELASGAPHYDLAMVANLAAPPSVPLMPAPTLHESVDDAIEAAGLVRDAAARESALKAVQQALADAPGAEWVAAARTAVDGSLAAEERLDRGYALLRDRAIAGADRDVRAGRVMSLERLIMTALRGDDRLGRSRPGEMASLMALLDARLDAARRVRLARDHWAMRVPVLQRYRASVAAPLAAVADSRAALEQIRSLAGPSRARLASLAASIARAERELAAIDVPPEAAAANALVRNVLQLASRAADMRGEAIASGDEQTAWQASSAAAGALLLLGTVSGNLKALTATPALPIASDTDGQRAAGGPPTQSRRAKARGGRVD